MAHELSLHAAATLSRRTSDLAVSLYLPSRSSEGSSEAGGRFACEVDRFAMLRDIEDRLRRLYPGRTDIPQFMAPLKTLAKELQPRHSEGGIGIFRSSTYAGFVHLPVKPPAFAVTSDSFHIKPILYARRLAQPYYLVILREWSASIIRAGSSFLSILDEVSLVRDYPIEPKDLVNELTAKLNWLCSSEPLPIMLAGKQSLICNLSDALAHQDIVPAHLYQNFSSHSNFQVNALAIPILESHFSLKDAHCASRYEEAHAWKCGIESVYRIGKAIAKNRVAELMIASDHSIWGKVDRRSGRVAIPRAGKRSMLCDDVLDDLAEIALDRGTKVTVIPASHMPRHLSIAAILHPKIPEDTEPIVSIRHGQGRL